MHHFDNVEVMHGKKLKFSLVIVPLSSQFASIESGIQPASIGFASIELVGANFASIELVGANFAYIEPASI